MIPAGVWQEIYIVRHQATFVEGCRNFRKTRTITPRVDIALGEIVALLLYPVFAVGWLDFGNAGAFF
jgi:hypothetical protein